MMRQIGWVRLSAGLLAAAGVFAPAFLSLVLWQWGAGETPCVMSGIERLAAAFAGTTLLFAALEGLSGRLAGLLLAQCLAGLWMCSRHLAMHGFGDIGQGFGLTVFGLHGYSWHLLLFVFLLFWLTAALTAGGSASDRPAKPLPRILSVPLFAAALLSLSSGFVTALLANGPPPFAAPGVGEQMTLSSLPERWTLSFWERAARPPVLSARNLPDADSSDQLQAAAPAAGADVLRPERLEHYPSPLAGSEAVRCFAWSEEENRFAFVSEHGQAALTDRTIHRVTARARLDYANGLTLEAPSGCAWLGKQFFAASQNKVLWALEQYLRPGGAPDSPGLIATTGNLRLSWGKNRAAVHTVRAREARISAFAADAGKLYMLAAPSAKTPRVILVTLDASDLMPLAEAPLSAAPRVLHSSSTSPAACRADAAAASGGRIYAYSRQCSALYVIDPAKAKITALKPFASEAPVESLAFRDGRLLFLSSREDGITVGAISLDRLDGIDQLTERSAK